MNLLSFSMIILLFPLAGIANPPPLKQKKIIQPVKQQPRHLRKPTNAADLMDLKPLVPPSGIILDPQVKQIVPSKPKGPTFFQLSKVPNTNQLKLSFESYDPNLKI